MVSPTRKARNAAMKSASHPVSAEGFCAATRAGQGDEDEQCHLIADDEQQVEDLELPGPHACAKNRPAVVLHARVAALAREVEGQAGSPGSHEHRHQHDARRSVALCEGTGDEDPHVGHGHDRPGTVDPRGVAGGQGQDPAGRAGGRGDDDHDQQGVHVAMLGPRGDVVPCDTAAAQSERRRASSLSAVSSQPSTATEGTPIASTG